MEILCPTHLPRPSINLGYTGLAPATYSVGTRSILPSIEELRQLPRRERRQARRGEVNGIDISYSAEAGHPRRDQPERFLHFDLQTREQGDALPPEVRPAMLGGRRGLLAEASSHEFAGEPYFANHVRFFWRQDGTRYAATLHNFGPDTRAVLAELVRTLRPAVDPTDPELAAGVRRVPTPIAGPVLIAADEERVWATGSRELIALDPESLRPASESIGIRGTPASVAARGSVWVAHPASYSHNERGFPRRRGDALQRLDPTGSSIAESIRAGTDPSGLALGLGSAWVSDLTGRRIRGAPSGDWPGRRGYKGGTVRRVDVRTGRVLASIRVGGAPAAIAVGERAVWATNNLDDTVSVIDPQTNRVTADVEVGDSPTGLATGFGAVWTANTADDTVSRIDPAANETEATISVGRGPRGVAVGEGSIWVSNYLDDTVSRIDPSTNHVIETIRVGPGPVGIAVGHRAVWVAVIHDRSLFRIDPD